MDPVEQRAVSRLAGILTFAESASRFIHIQMDEDLMPDDFQMCVGEKIRKLGDVAPSTTWAGNPAEAMATGRILTDQKWWSEKLHVRNRDNLLMTAVADDAVRLSCQVKPHA